MPKKLTARQLKIRVFANEYVRDFNGARAATAAGWSASRASQTASELLDDPECQTELEKVMQQREARSRVKAFRVLEHLAPLIESNVANYDTTDGTLKLAVDAPEDAMLAVASVEQTVTTLENGAVQRRVKFRLHSKPEAQRLGMQHLGMLKDRVEHTGANGAPLDFTVRFVRPEPKS